MGLDHSFLLDTLVPLSRSPESNNPSSTFHQDGRAALLFLHCRAESYTHYRNYLGVFTLKPPTNLCQWRLFH